MARRRPPVPSDPCLDPRAQQRVVLAEGRKQRHHPQTPVLAGLADNEKRMITCESAMLTRRGAGILVEAA
jgi:hypothetical protein